MLLLCCLVSTLFPHSFDSHYLSSLEATLVFVDHCVHVGQYTLNHSVLEPAVLNMKDSHYLFSIIFLFLLSPLSACVPCHQSPLS